MSGASVRAVAVSGWRSRLCVGPYGRPDGSGGMSGRPGPGRRGGAFLWLLCGPRLSVYGANVDRVRGPDGQNGQNAARGAFRRSRAGDLSSRTCGGQGGPVLCVLCGPDGQGTRAQFPAGRSGPGWRCPRLLADCEGARPRLSSIPWPGPGARSGRAAGVGAIRSGPVGAFRFRRTPTKTNGRGESTNPAPESVRTDGQISLCVCRGGFHKRPRRRP